MSLVSDPSEVQRLDALHTWLGQVLGVEDVELRPASADASFRRYFRLADPQGGTLIAMDAPPDKEATGPFIRISRLLTDAGLNAPRILASDSEQGFLLLTDLGDQSYLSVLNPETVQQLYQDALDALLLMQENISPTESSLPDYDDELLMQEMELFREWYLGKYRAISLTTSQQEDLQQIFQSLASMALSQPKVFVHRDYHSRNLMRTRENNPGILDFQDAVLGPVTYDLVSLLRDCYIAWPREQVEQWALTHLRRLQERGIIDTAVTGDLLLRWFDWMGIQRHLKATGIFARLYLRDDKQGYLADIPRNLAYMLEVSRRYPELAPLADLLESLEV